MTPEEKGKLAIEAMEKIDKEIMTLAVLTLCNLITGEALYTFTSSITNISTEYHKKLQTLSPQDRNKSQVGIAE